MSFLHAGILLGGSTAIRLAIALIAVKLIVIYTGADGLGQVGYLMNAISILATLAGAGILNGIIKRVAETQNRMMELRLVIGTSVTICMVWSAFMGVLLLAFAEPLSHLIFENTAYVNIFRWLAVGQFFMSCATLFNGYMSGRRMTVEFAILSTVGSLIGMAGLVIGVWQWGLLGAMLGLVWLNISPGIVMLCWSLFVWPRKLLALLKPTWVRREAATLLKFSLMLSMSALTVPLAQLYIQKLIYFHSPGWESIGYWQAAVRYTDTAIQFLAVILANYYLPRLAETNQVTQIKRVVCEAYVFVLPILLAFAAFSIFFPKQIILFLYSEELLPAGELFVWQAAGTLFKVLAYIIGYIAVAKARVRLYVGAEIFQAATLCIVSTLLVPQLGVIGASIAYAITYLIYFLLCVITMKIFIMKSKDA
jgi:antigen flippase